MQFVMNKHEVKLLGKKLGICIWFQPYMWGNPYYLWRPGGGDYVWGYDLGFITFYWN
jgi:hypothetical protein